MSAYTYRALTPEGHLIKGVVEGDSARQVRSQLRSRALRPVTVEASAAAGQPQTGGWQRWRQPRLTSRERALLTRQLATLVQGAMPLDEALAAVAQQTRRAAGKSMLLHVCARVRAGHTLAYALGELPLTFDDMYCAMVRAGESTGFLGPVLAQLADYQESTLVTRQKLQMAMIYPLILMAVAGAVIALLMVFVVPKLVGVFAHSRQALPPLTEALIAISHFVAGYGWLLLLALSAAAWGVRSLLRRPRCRRRWHGLLLRLPLAGRVATALDTARFASTLSILVASGVPLLDGLRIAGAVLVNTELRGAADTVALAVQEGGSLHRSLAATGRFPPMLVHMVASGEASGELETMLTRAAQTQERELELTLGALLALFEPLLVVLMAGVVGVIVLAILQPIIAMNSLVR